MSQLDKPSQWATGGEPPTEKQTCVNSAPGAILVMAITADIARARDSTFIKTLAAEKGADIDTSDLNKSSASAAINDLKNKETQNPDATAGEPIQDPSSWSTGEDKATGKQQGYIAAMAKEAWEKVPGGDMGKSEASQKIGDLKSKTGM